MASDCLSLINCSSTAAGYRDIAYYYKLFLNPDIRRFPAKHPWTQKDAELIFHYDDGSERFYVTGFQDSTLSCRPRVKRGESVGCTSREHVALPQQAVSCVTDRLAPGRG